MTNRYAFALVILLAAAPAAAQPEGPVPVGPGPIGIGPVGPAPVGAGPVGPGPQGIGPVSPFDDDLQGPRKLIVPPIDIDLDSPLMKLVVPPIDLDLQGPLMKLATMPDIDLQGPLMKIANIDMTDIDMKIEHAFDKVVEANTMLAKVFDQDRGRDREAELREREKERESQAYNEGLNAANESRYDRALTYMNRVIELKGEKVDRALYWKAYSQNKMGQRSEALLTLAELSKNYPNSGYRKQATVLEAEVRRDIGQPVRPQDSADDEVKLMALAAMQGTAPEEAIPILEKLLEGTASPRVKQRALFVLAQSKSPRAREVLRNYAKGSSTPELQMQAIRYLGVHGGPESRAILAEVYGATTDVDVKRRILRAFMEAGEKDRLFKAAQGEQNPELRAEAVTQLGNMGAHDELWQLYQKETSIDVKRRILRSMQAGGNIDRLIDLAKTEQNPELRREAVRALGATRSTRTGDVLVQIYGVDTNPEVRKSVINALFIQENAPALVGLARKEQDINMKKELVGRLAQMRSKVATDYMIELLGK